MPTKKLPIIPPVIDAPVVPDTPVTAVSFIDAPIIDAPVDDEHNEKNVPRRFPIVGIGASAGGLEAFEQFFRNAPVNSGMAFVLVPHLDPSHASLLTEILQRNTTMPVVEALNQLKVKPNCVYIIPPNRDMEISNGKLQLSVPNAPRGQRMPIDAFLRSLAEDQTDYAIGIILSGTGTDGTLGLRTIVGAGGISLVQEPTTAKYDGMPISAIHSGYATYILHPDKMLETLLSSTIFLDLSHNPDAELIHHSNKEKISGVRNVLMQLRNLTGHDFTGYKKSTISRRIERRMLKHSIDEFDSYARYLKAHPSEAHILFQELLINVTNFFRDPEAFLLLEQQILPDLLKDKFDDEFNDYIFRAWVAGCATGEEAYSLAILLREYMNTTHREFKVQLYSTDLDDEAIATARTGFYPLNIAQDVTPERLEKFFIKEENGYRIKKEIREMVVFAVQNVIKDPPFTKLDFLSCRNLMIYLTPELQDRLITAFHYALKPDGVLLLSPSESIGNHTGFFSAVNHKWKFYRASHSAASTRAMMMVNPLSYTAQSDYKLVEEVTTVKKLPNFAELTNRILIRFFAPASVVTDLTGDILYVHGETGKYLRPAPGNATLNVIEMAREGLDLELRTAIYIAACDGVTTLNREMEVKTNGGFTTVSLSVRVLPDLGSGQKQLLISFQDIPKPVVKRGRKRVNTPAELSKIEELEYDLSNLKQSYLANIEEQQSSNEELKSTNEEMQSTNEELQSTNEELETSKEELQSVNEEMITVNSELQRKIEQLADIQNDMKNLLDNINVGILFLDSHLIIRRFTRETLRIYRLVNSDVGRPLNDIKCMAEGDDLLHASQKVLETLIPYECELRLAGNVWVLARIQPYRTLDNVIGGVVLTFTDITSRVQVIATEEALALAETIVNTIPDPFLILDNKLCVAAANRLFYQSFQFSPEDIVGYPLFLLGEKQLEYPDLRECLKMVLTNDKTFEDYELEYDFPTIGHRWLTMNARRIVGKIGVPKMILLSLKLNSKSKVDEL
ncbi:MAG: chemotaxis protein CheB [Methylococcaceae bacterium]